MDSTSRLQRRHIVILWQSLFSISGLREGDALNGEKVGLKRFRLVGSGSLLTKDEKRQRAALGTMLH